MSRIGGRDFSVAPLNGRKAILAGRFLARITKKVPDLIERDAHFQRTYGMANALRINRSMALSTWKGRIPELTDEQWAAIGGEIVIPQPPDDDLRVANVFTEAFEAAEEEVLKLLALTVVADNDLADAAKGKNGVDIKEFLTEKSDELLDNGKLSELLDLAVEAAGMLRSEFEGEALGKLRALLGLNPAQEEDLPGETPAAPESAAEEPEEPSTTAAEIPSTPEDAPEPTPTSSTDSPTPTAGTGSESSTAPPGSSSEPSVLA